MISRTITPCLFLNSCGTNLCLSPNTKDVGECDFSMILKGCTEADELKVEEKGKSLRQTGEKIQMRCNKRNTMSLSK